MIRAARWSISSCPWPKPWDGGLRHAPAVTTTSFDISILDFSSFGMRSQIVIATAEQAADVASLKNC